MRPYEEHFLNESHRKYDLNTYKMENCRFFDILREHITYSIYYFVNGIYGSHNNANSNNCHSLIG